MAGAHDHGSAGRIPFWVHQLVELLLAVLLLVEGARNGEHTVVLVCLGGMLLLLALCSDGALGAWPWIGRRVHRALDLVAAAVLAVSPLVLGLDGVFAIVLIELAAIAMVWLAVRTEWREKPGRRRAGRQQSTPAPGTDPVPPPEVGSPPAPRAPSPRLARTLGRAVGRARDDGPRQLGRMVGRAQRAAKASMASDSPPSPAAAEPPEASAPAEPDPGGRPSG
jgi:hypothetical protein